MSGLFTIGFVLCFFLYVDQFSRWAFGWRESVLSCVGIFALMIVIEVLAIEILGWAMAKFGSRAG